MQKMDRKKKSFLSDKDNFELERKLERIYRNQSKRFKSTGEHVGEYVNKSNVSRASPSTPTNSPETSSDTDSIELSSSQDEKPKLKKNHLQR